jgi:hypothetical protein
MLADAVRGLDEALVKSASATQALSNNSRRGGRPSLTTTKIAARKPGFDEVTPDQALATLQEVTSIARAALDQ